MPIVNPDPLRYPGIAATTGGAAAPSGADPSSASAWLQQQPWYRQTLESWGNPKTLTLGQRGYLARTAQQQGLNPDFGVSTDGSVEDWSTPTASKIALAAFAAAATAGAAGAFGGGGASATGAGSGAAAGGSGVAGTSAASGAGWFSPANIIPSAIQGIASIFGANQQANASSEAAQLQYKSTEEALADARAQRDYEKSQYANYLGRLQPYLGLGTNASSTLQNLLARSPYTKLANNGPLPQYSTAPVRPQPQQPQGPGAMASTAQGISDLQTRMGGNTGAVNTGGVKLQAPDGSVKVISDPAQIEHYKAAGAQVVG